MSKRTDRLFGLHAVKQVLENSPDTILNIWVQQSLESESIRSIHDIVNNLGISIQSVPRSTLDKMAKKQNHQGVMLEVRKLAKKTEHDLDDVLEKNKDSNPLYLILDSVQDPHNLGACIRTADAAGVTAVIIPNDRAASVNETVRKVASGAVENVTIISVVNLVRAIKKIKEAGGLSGKPLQAQSTQIIKILNQAVDHKIPIIGVGGIMDGDDAKEKFDAGASLVQIYTGFIYKGPSLIKEIVMSLRH